MRGIKSDAAAPFVARGTLTTYWTWTMHSEKKNRTYPSSPGKMLLGKKSSSRFSDALSRVAIATESSHIPGRVVCLIQVSNRWVIGLNNQERTSPHYERILPDGTRRSTEHAEMRALQMARKIGGKIRQVIVLRFKKNWEVSMARPCSACYQMLIEAGIPDRKIYYSGWNGELERMNK